MGIKKKFLSVIYIWSLVFPNHLSQMIRETFSFFKCRRKEYGKGKGDKL
jgi:hypothetical protein